MARWSPTVLPYAPDPFEAGDRIARGVMGGAQLHQGQQRIDEFVRRGDMMSEEQDWILRQREADIRNQEGWQPDGEARQAPGGGPGISGGGTKEGPGMDMPGYTPPSESVSTRSTPNLSSDPNVAGPLGAAPQFGAGDIRNQPQVSERLQMVTGGTMAAYGQKPADVHAAGERKRRGGQLMDVYGEALGMDQGSDMRALMEDTGAMPPIMQPHQKEGYGSPEAMAEDAYGLNRVSPSVLAALIRSQSAEGGGGMSAQRQNDILTERFNDAVAFYMESEKAAGREVSVQEAYSHVMSEDERFLGANTSMLDFAGDYPDIYGTGNLAGVSVTKGTGTADPEVTRLVEEVMQAGNMEATLNRISRQNDPAIVKAVVDQIAVLQTIQWMQRYGTGAYVGSPD
jgi:hypothetical protein